MCTLSFLPLADGFALAMNRDEQLNRVTARPPSRHAIGGGFAIYPAEPGGGTWIGVRENGFAMALLNWYAHPVRPDCLSRGRLIPQLLNGGDYQSATNQFVDVDLARTNPFRLVCVDTASEVIREFRWDGTVFSFVDHPWKIAHWYSSGFDEPGVIVARSAVARKAALQPDMGSIAWVRRLHASHEVERGPYSICMHRTDAQTVSYTEIEFTADHPDLRYLPCSPCQATPLPTASPM